MGRRRAINREKQSAVWCMRVRPSSEGTERSELEVGLQSGDKKGFSVELSCILPIIFNLWMYHRMLKESPAWGCQDRGLRRSSK